MTGAAIHAACLGSLVVAQAGLLDGREATTHWAWIQRARQQYPQVSWDAARMICDTGDVITAGGFLAAVEAQTLPYGLQPFAATSEAERAASDGAPLGPAHGEANRTAELEAYTAQLARIGLPERQSDPITGEGLGMLIEDIATGRRRVHIVNVPNRVAQRFPSPA